MSATQLAEQLDSLADEGRTYVAESDTAVTVSNLTSELAAELQASASALTWQVEAFDSAGNFAQSEFDTAFQPYRLVVHKPPAAAGTLRILTNTGFRRQLVRDHSLTRWQIASLEGVITTGTRRFEPWEFEHSEATISQPTKSPRSLVREYGDRRHVPDDIRPWLSDALPPDLFATRTAQTWACVTALQLIRSLPDELDPVDGSLRFRGPPRCSAPSPGDDGISLDQPSFEALQTALKWVFENEREAEMRHILLATELARSGGRSTDIVEFVRENLTHALESAQLAYQMALADTSRDTLKVLSDLRKAVTDETVRLNDISRQLGTAIAGALAMGTGLIAVRITAGTPTWLNVVVAALVAVYVLVTIGAGVSFILLQRRLRTEWQPRLYRFLPAAEYRRMVDDPITHAEKGFLWIAWVGGIAVLALALVCATPFSLHKASLLAPQNRDSIELDPLNAPTNTDPPRADVETPHKSDAPDSAEKDNEPTPW